MNIKQPSIFVQLEKYENICICELGTKKLGKNIINIMETIEVIDTQKPCVLFRIEVPLVKSWKVLVQDTQGYIHDYENVVDAYEYSVLPHIAMNYKLLFPLQKALDKIECKVHNSFSDFKKRMYNLNNNFFTSI